jgi:hypothetical protein
MPEDVDVDLGSGSFGMNNDTPSIENDFPAEVRARFGVLPDFFCTAASAPGLIEELWGFAKSAT